MGFACMDERGEARIREWSWLLKLLWVAREVVEVLTKES